jgi:succinate dehydrogenase / fumarate reductase cytochrome b subunit
MVAFVIVHVAGNLQIFLGRGVFNRYSQLLHTSEEMLWAVRSVLIASVILHVLAAYQLTVRDRAARGVRYRKSVPQVATLASRLMRWGGVLILVFIPLHLLNFTTGSWHPAFMPGDAYGNVVFAFRAWPWLAAFYVAVMVFVGLHLYHGVWAMMRTLGIAPPSATPMKRRGIAALAWAVAVGFIVVPLVIVAGFLG